MSSILEALKKLEDEKAAKKSGAGNIAGKVVKPGRRAKQQPKWILPAAMALVATVAVLATYLFMAGRTAPTGTVAERPAVQPKRAEIQPRHPSSPAAAPAPIPPSPATSAGKEPAAQPPPPAPLQKPSFAGASAPHSQAVTAPAESPASTPKPEAKPPLPSLKVTGIGWQKDNAERLAIVNGRPVMEGAMIEGARVEEIFPDRVRFSFDDSTIEVPLGRFPDENP